MTQYNPGMEEIQARRRKLLDGFDANAGFEQGIYDGAKDLYAQKCHFIYELLQNAEDVGASHVEFRLLPDALVFRHDGIRAFSTADVESITNYHRSTKGEDYEAVGKFGMGFKAVYNYTQTPEIHSGAFHFRITRMFYPETKDVPIDEGLEGWTKFIFPFRHSDKPKWKIHGEILEGLREIRNETLLFLTHISQITCRLGDDGGDWIAFTREDHGALVRIRKTGGRLRTVVDYFLKFSRPIQIVKKGNACQSNIALAYALSSASNGTWSPDAPLESLPLSCFKLCPLDSGKVFIFFPTARENSGLKFHIHAPFASPMSREVLTEGPENDRLLCQIADLAVESLPFLRDNGVLGVDQLGVFPIHTDALESRYEVFRTRIAAAFNTSDLTPTLSGTYRPARELRRSENRMSDVLTDADLARIYPTFPTPAWVKAPSDVTSRARWFLEKQLEIEVFNDHTLQDLATGMGRESTAFVLLLQTFDDSKLLQVYRHLLDVSKSGRTLAYREIFRTTTGRSARAENLYFDVSGPFHDLSGFHFLKKIYPDADEEMKSFLRRCGVRELSLETFILESQRRLKAGEAELPQEKLIREHMGLVRNLLALFRRPPEDLETIKKEFCWLCLDRANRLCLKPACEVLIDDPYESTGMRALADIWVTKGVLWGEYGKHLSPGEYREFTQCLKQFPFLRRIKVDDHLKYGIDGSSLSWHPRFEQLRPPAGARPKEAYYVDWDIDQLDAIVKRRDDRFSRAIWDCLMRIAAQNRGDANLNPLHIFVHYTKQCEKTADSSLVCKLQKLEWLKDRNGEWKHPAEVNFQSLHEMYQPRQLNGVLNALKFGVRVKDNDRAALERQRGRAELLAMLDCQSEEQLRTFFEEARMMHSAGLSHEELREIAAKKRAAAEMPGAAVMDVSRREARVGEQYANANERKYEIHARQVLVGHTNASEVRAYLLRFYLDDHRLMRCQLCKNAMPFRKRDGQFYFECVQIFKGLPKECSEQYLALCPTCAALYGEWIREHGENRLALRNQILARQVSTDEKEVEISLPTSGTGNCPQPPMMQGYSHRSLYFTARHFIDLRTILRQSNG